MSDDLVKRLRNNCSCNFSSTPCGAEEECRNAFEAADRIEELEAALRAICEVYAGSEGIPKPMTAAEGYLLKLLTEAVAVASIALGEKKDD